MLKLARRVKDNGERIGNYGISFLREMIEAFYEDRAILSLQEIFYFNEELALRKVYRAKLLERINYKSSPFILKIYKVFLKGSKISLEELKEGKEKEFQGEYFIIKRKLDEEEYEGLARKTFLALLKNLKNTAPIILTQSKKLFKIDGKVERVEGKPKIAWDELSKEIYIDDFPFFDKFVIDFKRVDEMGITYRIKIPFPYSKDEIEYELERDGKVKEICAYFDDEGVGGEVEIDLGNETVKIDRRIICAAQTWLYNVAYEESRDKVLDEELKEAENFLFQSK